MPQFEVEWAGLVAGDQLLVLARALASGDFQVPEGTTLGDCLLLPAVEMPRAIRPDGVPRLDLFAFQLAEAQDLQRLVPGQVVALTTPQATIRETAP